MKISPEIYTNNVEACERFYINHFGFKLKSRAEGFVVLQNASNPEYELMFCVPNSPFVHDVFHPEFNGKGVILQFETDHIEKEYERVKALGIEVVVDLVDEEVNGKQFTIKDPSGLLVDIVNFQ